MLDLVSVASLITSATVVLTCVYKLYNLARRVENKLDAYDKNLAQLNLHLNKMALLDTNMPIMDRIHAGELYLANGGNGLGKKVYEQLLSELDTSIWSNNNWSNAQKNGLDKEKILNNNKGKGDVK